MVLAPGFAGGSISNMGHSWYSCRMYVVKSLQFQNTANINVDVR